MNAGKYNLETKEGLIMHKNGNRFPSFIFEEEDWEELCKELSDKIDLKKEIEIFIDKKLESNENEKNR